MSKISDKPEDIQPLWRRVGKGVVGAGITAAYVTGLVLAAPITLGVAAGLGVLRGFAMREKKQGLLSVIGRGAIQGIMAPFAASATLAIDAVKGQKTSIDELILNSGKKMPEMPQIPGFKQEAPGQKQPLWKRIGKTVAGLAILGGTIAACAVAGPAVAVAVAVAAVTGGYKGYKGAKADENKILGAIKGAVNRVISPIAISALLISHGVQGCKTESLAVDVFKGVKGQFVPENQGHSTLTAQQKSQSAPENGIAVSEPGKQVEERSNATAHSIKDRLINGKPTPPPKLPPEKIKEILARREVAKALANQGGRT